MDEICSGFSPHPFRNICEACRRPPENHPLNQDSVNSILLALHLDNRQERSNQADYTWVPRGCPEGRLSDYFRNFPEEKVPTPESEGQRHRERQYVIQFPLQDIYTEMCRSLKEDEDFLEYQNYTEERNTTAVGEGQVIVLNEEKSLKCVRCQGLMTNGELAVISPTAGHDYAWHPACFVCHDCGEQPVDLIHCYVPTGKVYCLRHYGEYKINRCYACDELICGRSLLKIIEKNWHPEHFCCMLCDMNLIGTRFFPENGHPYCRSCYDRLFRHTCKKCNQLITVDQSDFSFRNEHYHENCLSCDLCSKHLNDENIAHHEGPLLCSGCYKARYTTLCPGCSERVEPHHPHEVLQNERWHAQCFVCSFCRRTIAKQIYASVEDKKYCVQCYKEHFCLKCTKCQESILSSGVLLHNHPYHQECVYCESCNQLLDLDVNVLSREGKLYCERCYRDIFGNVCNHCKEHIGPHSQYVTWEPFVWHQECYKCTRCSKSLVNERVTKTKDGLLCEECKESTPV